ncbi:MAG: glycoside hydrolase family 2 TIM barrel-domain containing protein [Rikenellaceae bacterium]
MKLNLIKLSGVLLTAVMLMACSSPKIEREVDFNFDWKFTELKDTVTLSNLPLDDSAWRDVRLPHDWSVEHSFDENLEGCTGYLPGGVGVYQKHFTTQNDSSDKSTYVLFDGVYNNSKYWLNGEYLGENPYGYSPVYFNLTDKLKPVGEDNVLTVYVDHSHYADSRWYTGSGIYRNVKLITTDKLHIPVWGVFVTTPEVEIAADGEHAQRALVNMEVSVINENVQAKDFVIKTKVVDASGKSVASQGESLSIAASQGETYNQQIEVKGVKLWDTQTPDMYVAVTSIEVDGVVVDEYRVPFGVRTLLFDKDKGFFLNGKQTYAKGVCLHHDAGLVGAAVPKGVWRRRLEILKEGGVNSIRTSHNPFSEEFLDLCDEMGFLVQHEIFDEMDNPKDKRFNFDEKEPLYRTEGYDNFFQEWGESDLKRTMMRDRNHPSVFMWSIGNEIEWTYPEYKHVSGLFDKGMGGYWNAIPKLTPEEMKARYDALPPQKYVLTETAERLVKWVKEMDTTRPVTANQIIPVASSVTGFSAALDVVSVSYQIAQYDWLKKHNPDMMFTGGENTGLLQEWKSITDNPMVFSMYMWTGIDYLGETNGRWPQKAWHGDMLDLAAFKKAGFNHFQSIWIEEPMIALQTHRKSDSKFDIQNGEFVNPAKKGLNWSNYLSEPIWNFEDGEMIIVEVVTNQPSATLYLNGRDLGSRKLVECPDNIMRWAVKYEPGCLEARADVDGKVISSTINSAGKVEALDVDVDNVTLVADGYDVAHIEVQLTDKDGNPVKVSEKKIHFDVKGAATLLGVDNGWSSSVQKYQSDEVETRLGRALAIIQSQRGATGDIKVTVSAPGVKSQEVTIKVK